MGRTPAHRRLMPAALTVLVLGAVGLVYAAWTTSGSGSGYAKAKTAQALSTVDVSASTTATLYPTGDGDVLIKIHNPNPYQVTVLRSPEPARSPRTPDIRPVGRTARI